MRMSARAISGSAGCGVEFSTGPAHFWAAVALAPVCTPVVAAGIRPSFLSSAWRHEITRTPSRSTNGLTPQLLPVIPMDLKVFHRTKTPQLLPVIPMDYRVSHRSKTALKTHLMPPLTKWLDSAQSGMYTGGLVRD